MPDLPPGWRVSNSEGSFRGPPVIDSDEGLNERGEDGSSSSMDEDLDIQPDSPGWEDIEPQADVEVLNVKCLICEEIFNDASVMLDHCRSEHSFDFLEIRRLNNLDFYSTIKLVNYIRSEVRDGRLPDVPDLANPSLWADEKYLQPAMEEDALLFSLYDLVDFGEVTDTGAEPMSVNRNGVESSRP